MSCWLPKRFELTQSIHNRILFDEASKLALYRINAPRSFELRAADRATCFRLSRVHRSPREGERASWLEQITKPTRLNGLNTFTNCSRSREGRAACWFYRLSASRARARSAWPRRNRGWFAFEHDVTSEWRLHQLSDLSINQYKHYARRMGLGREGEHITISRVELYEAWIFKSIAIWKKPLVSGRVARYSKFDAGTKYK